MLALETALDAADKLGMAITREQRSSWRRAADSLKLSIVVFNGRHLHKEYDQYTFSNSLKDNTTQHPSIGQGDTVLLGFPLQFNDSHRLWGGQQRQIRLNDITYCAWRLPPAAHAAHATPPQPWPSCVGADATVFQKPFCRC